MHKLEIAHKIEDEAIDVNAIIGRLKYIRGQIDDASIAQDLTTEIHALVDHRNRLRGVVTTIVEDSQAKNQPLSK